MSGNRDMVGILRHRQVAADISCLNEAHRILEAAGLQTWEVVRDAPYTSRDGRDLSRTRLLLTLGGDGTLLHGARLAAPRGIPLLGVNLGRLGFLTELEADELASGLERFLADEHWLDERTLLDIEVVREDRRLVKAVGLNEAVVERATSGQLLRLRVLVDSQEVGVFDADGVIAATSTGSTSYALAAGGPILDPRVSGLVLVPMLPFALTMRPIVFPPKQALTVEITRAVGQLSVDGRRMRSLQEGDRVRVASHDQPLCLVRFSPRERFYSLLREKLGWGLPLVPTVRRG
ncbi:MAG TPA: NAD(+)/NADH kinase [Candidatus Dormibacteraeota bacterium]|nr:NAD(+)/NADH kinase [Candidatus Dormibacteraeota bacterium]